MRPPRGQSESVQIIVQRVVAEIGVQTDLDVVAFPTEFFEDGAHLITEITFYFEDKSADALFGIAGTIAQQLSRVGIHATVGLAAANGAEDDDAGEEASFRDS